MILLTGGTGFLGSALIDKFLESRPELSLCILIRGDSLESCQNKLEASCQKSIIKYGKDFFNKKITVIKGDISQQNLGLSSYDREMLKNNISAIYNNAADTNLGGTFEDLSKINIFGTSQTLKLANEISIKNRNFKFYHISTAYVAGDQDGVKLAEDLDLGVRFRNAYEQTKAIAESIVRSEKDNFQVITFRPSIIVGDSKTGVTSAFNVLYIPARFIISGLLKVVPALPHAPFDVVPVDYVAESIVNAHGIAIRSGSTFHLSSGIGRETSPSEILDLLFSTAKSFGNTRPPSCPSFISQEKVQKALGSVSSLAQHVYQSSAFKNFEKIVCEKLPVFRQIMPLIPYMISNPRFNNQSTLNVFSGSIKEAPLFTQYGENIFRYCFQTDWGKRNLVNAN